MIVQAHVPIFGGPGTVLTVPCAAIVLTLIGEHRGSTAYFLRAELTELVYYAQVGLDLEQAQHRAMALGHISDPGEGSPLNFGESNATV